MPSLVGKNITVDFPIYGGGSRSLKKSIVNAASGGFFARDASERLVVRALDGISFNFSSGDRVGLFGHNGAGKSTLLRVMAGIYEPTSGSFISKGRVASMLSITLGIDPEATGFENIFTRGYLMGIKPKAMNTLVDEIVHFSGLGDFLHLPYRTYSSGMAMRLAFSIATCVNADIILMDEWLSVGDAEFVDRAKVKLEKMINEAGIVVLASHNLDLIKSQCNKIYQVNHGKIDIYSEF
ncbi:ABC transporter ATP-binding protein [Polynucleobacter sp. UB-Tiil-W10]|uniref:ABC transporter ATP-binding protein n=1 Tax=Polynucleobacter sp. UB-Tiil-W10 TaxID=1855648 RepID=UPI001C0D8FD0|nr:ABC transporter ATP-binding protein [Polynucleobacter sp. UB-Tiil-W10]MBU3540837.1 ABC transporter ATP-binding protein [Polynucleobacter sp. UB-Tiil-W10]